MEKEFVENLAPSAMQLAGSAIIECEHKLKLLIPAGEHRTRALLKLMEAWFWARHQLEVADAEASQVQQAASRLIRP